MWEKLTSLSTGDLTVIGVCILAVNLLLVILITIAVNKRAKKQSAVTEPIRKKVTNSGVYVSPTPLRVNSPLSLNVLGIRENLSQEYQYGVNWATSAIQQSYKGSVPPVKIMNAMLDFGDGEEVKTVYGEYDINSFIDGSTFHGKYFRARKLKRIEKRIPLENKHARVVVLGTIVPKHQ